VLTVLRGRGLAVPKAASQRIRAQTDLEQLQRWLERAIDAISVDEVIRERAVVRSAKALRRTISGRAGRAVGSEQPRCGEISLRLDKPGEHRTRGPS
jgi:hypothetical protein